MAKDTETTEAEEKAGEAESTAETDEKAEQATETQETAKGAEEAAEGASEATEEASAPDWRELLSDKEAKKLADRYESLDAVFKGIGELQKQISNRIAVPGKDADEKEVAKFRKAMGIPEKPDDYKVELPEGVELSEADEAMVEAIKPVAHEQNIPAEALSGFISKFKEFEAQALNEHQAEIERQAEEAQTALRKEWGKDYDANLNIANRALSQLGGDELTEFVNKTELKSGGVIGNDPNMVRLFAKLGRRMSEDGAIEPVDADEAKDLQQKMEDLTSKIHAAHQSGDRITVEKLSRQRSEISERLYGEQPIVGSGGRSA